MRHTAQIDDLLARLKVRALGTISYPLGPVLNVCPPFVLQHLLLNLLTLSHSTYNQRIRANRFRQLTAISVQESMQRVAWLDDLTANSGMASQHMGQHSRP